MAMMTLGLFVFSMDTLPYQDFKHSLGWRHPSNSRVGARPSRQYLGTDDETITLSGVLLPEITGGGASLRMLRQMADSGKAWPLIEGTGDMLGVYVIEKLDLGRSVFFADGAARRVEFTLALARVDDTRTDLLGDVGRYLQDFLA